MGPGLAPDPPVKKVSMDGRGGSVIVGRDGAGAEESLAESSFSAIVPLSLSLSMCVYVYM